VNTNSSAYGLWLLVVVNSAVFILFAFSFARPRTSRDWRSFGAFSAFLVALFTEMHGFPLTIYLLSGWLERRSPGTDVYSHDAGHLWETAFGWDGDPHANPLHLLSYVVIGAGFYLLAKAWPVLYRAQRAGELATTGPYAAIRHPQYVAFVAIMFGFLLQWPTIVTAAMFPILTTMYYRLARREERQARAALGDGYAVYAKATPGFVPRRTRRSSAAVGSGERVASPS
jgi:protein-S-isoprenylcysteine O-methyltransferase Ste14